MIFFIHIFLLIFIRENTESQPTPEVTEERKEVIEKPEKQSDVQEEKPQEVSEVEEKPQDAPEVEEPKAEEKTAEGEEDDMPALIDETPIEDALPEEVMDISSKEESVEEETTNVESEADPVPKKHIIDILFDFVRTDEELNPVLCGYFTKFLYALMNHSRSSFFKYVFNPENEVVEYLIKHIYNRSIADCLIKILPEDTESSERNLNFALKVINSMETQDHEGKINSAHVLSEIMDTKAYSEIYKSLKVNQRLFELLKSEDELTVRSTFIFLNALYKKFPFYYSRPASDSSDDFAKLYLPSGDQNEEDLVIYDHIDDLLKHELPTIASILDQETSENLGQQYGEIIKPFGATRIYAVKFISSIIAQGNTDYALNLAACLTPLLNYCVQYPWNSMLHNYVEMIFNDLFKKDSKYSDEIRTAVIAETGLADFIADIETEVPMPESGRIVRSGPIATFVVIANMLNNHTSEYVREELHKSDKWLEFISGELLNSNENNERALAGHQSKAGDSDEESANYETSMDKLFAVFTNLKESHDSSRELEDSDEDEKVDTTNILGDLNSSTDSTSSGKEETIQVEEAKETPSNTGKNYNFSPK